MGGVQDGILNPASNRRTIYSFLDRSEPPGVFRTFDHPSPNATAPARFETIVPQQALFLMNSPFIIHQSKFLGSKIGEQIGESTETKIQRFYRDLFQREPVDEEMQIGLEFITSMEDSVTSVATHSQQSDDEKICRFSILHTTQSCEKHLPS